MAEVEIKSNIKLGLSDILEGIAKLDVEEIEVFLQEVAGILALKKKGAGKEVDLIKKIKSSYPIKLKKQYNELYQKMEDGGITQKEQEKLIEISDKLESLDAQRLKYLLALAQLRGQDLNLVIKEFSSSNFHA